MGQKRTTSLASRVRPEITRLSVGVLCLGATNALGFAIPAVLKRVIDGLAAGQRVVAEGALLMILLAVMQAVIRTVSRTLIFNSGRNIEYALRRDLFGFLSRQAPDFFQKHPIGDLMSRLTNDLSAVRMLFGPGVLNIANTAIVYIFGLYLLLNANPRLTAVALLPLPLVVLIGRIGGRSVHTASRAIQDQLGHLSTALQEDLTGIAVVRAYTLEQDRARRFATLNQEYFRRSLMLARARGTMGPIFALAGGLGTLIVLWLGSREVIAGRMTVGSLVAFNAYLVYLSWPTIALGWVLALWQRGVAAWMRVRDLLSEVETELDTAEPTPLAPSLRVQGLTVERDGRAVLSGLSLAVRPGQTVALVGRTGSGKSTLADALLGFVPVPDGTIFVGDRDIRSLSPRTLRTAIAYAPQEAFLFSTTVAENIAFGRPGAPMDAGEIRAAAEAAGLERDVAGFPDGYETVVGERGITLSGGQRQRVALARALYGHPRILVLDDSLSSVDVGTEREILDRLRPLLAERTTLLISNRVNAVRDADEILVLDAGAVVERGTHADLLARGGLYASLCREQVEREAA